MSMISNKVNQNGECVSITTLPKAQDHRWILNADRIPRIRKRTSAYP